MSTLRQRKPGAAPANGLAEAGAGTNGAPRTVVIDSSSGYLGVTLSDVEDGVGVLIAQCDVMDLISRSGLKAGDRITKVNGKSVSSHSKALAAMTDKKADGRLEIEYCTVDDVIELLDRRRAGRRSIVKRIVMAIFALVALANAAAFGMYFTADLYCHVPSLRCRFRDFRDYVDVEVLPTLGYPKPEKGYDGKPKRPVSAPLRARAHPRAARAHAMDALARAP